MLIALLSLSQADGGVTCRSPGWGSRDWPTAGSASRLHFIQPPGVRSMVVEQQSNFDMLRVLFRQTSPKGICSTVHTRVRGTLWCVYDKPLQRHLRNHHSPACRDGQQVARLQHQVQQHAGAPVHAGRFRAALAQLWWRRGTLPPHCQRRRPAANRRLRSPRRCGGETLAAQDARACNSTLRCVTGSLKRLRVPQAVVRYRGAQ